MILPRFSIKLMFGVTAVFGCLSVILAMAVRGNMWAIAASFSLGFVATAFVIYVLVFTVGYCIMLLVQSLKPRPATIPMTPVGATPFASPTPSNRAPTEPPPPATVPEPLSDNENADETAGGE